MALREPDALGGPRGALAVSLVVLAACLAFGQHLRNDLLNWDDWHYVLNNPLLAEPGLGGIARAFLSFHAGAYAPLSFITFMLERALFGPEPTVFHLTNVLIHAATAAVLFHFFYAAFKDRSAAFLAALLFAAHPALSESVAWVTQRATLLGGFFSAAAMLAWARERRGICWALFAAAAMAKPQAVALPAVLWVLERSRAGGPRIRGFGWAAFWSVSALMTSVTIAAAKGTFRASGNFEGSSFGERLVWVLYGPVFYLKNLLWPAELSAFYAARPAVDAVSAVELALFYGAAVLLWVRPRTAAPVRWGVAAYIVFLIPSLPFFELRHALYADRQLYIASSGFFLAVAWVLCGRGRAGKTVGYAAAVVLCALSIAQAPIWKSGLTLWTHVLKTQGADHAFIWFNLANARRDAGDWPGAVEGFDRAIALDPGYAEALHNRGHLYFGMGKYERALEDLDRSIAAHSGEPLAFMNRGLVKYRLGRPAEALEDLSRAVELAPNEPKFKLKREALRRQMGMTDRA